MHFSSSLQKIYCASNTDCSFDQQMGSVARGQAGFWTELKGHNTQYIGGKIQALNG